jgi:hypothetical protein
MSDETQRDLCQKVVPGTDFNKQLLKNRASGALNVIT